MQMSTSKCKMVTRMASLWREYTMHVFGYMPDENHDPKSEYGKVRLEMVHVSFVKGWTQ